MAAFVLAEQQRLIGRMKINQQKHLRPLFLNPPSSISAAVVSLDSS